MANAISAALDNLKTKLDTLVPATLTAVKRKIIVPAQEPNLPVLGMVALRVRRETATWTCDLALPLLARAGEDAADEVVFDLIGDVTEAIEALMDAGTAGAHISRPRWEFWQTLVGGNLRKVGAIGMISMTIDDPLKTD